MATLINGNGNPRIYAAQDADLIAALAGDITGIAQIGNKFAATAVDANTISVADGVIVTKEGRRIQLDAGSTDMFVIPTGTTGVTNYYIIGYKLTTQSDDSQIAETFVQLMSSSSETITEDTFREGATDVYVSLYRVQQNGVNLGTITGLLPELTNISELNNDLGNKPNIPTSYTIEWQNITVGQTINLGSVINSHGYLYLVMSFTGGGQDSLFVPVDGLRNMKQFFHIFSNQYLENTNYYGRARIYMNSNYQIIFDEQYIGSAISNTHLNIALIE